jgi:alpha-tubulin suppressor-like RCC1 family protein
MEYLSLDISDELLEDMFYKYDYNLTGTIDYYEFREIYLEICDQRKELESRDIECPSLIRKNTLIDILRQILEEEEDRERRAIAEAKRYKKWILNSRDSKRLMQKAEFRAYSELRSAMDAGGHVYVMGSGRYGQFNQQPYQKFDTKKHKFEFYDKVLQLWKDRIQPDQIVDRLRGQRRAEEQEDARDADRTLTGISAILKDLKRRKKVADPFEEAEQSPFIGLNVSLNTASLWCRRIYQVAASENVLFALADTGEIYTWGGNSFWWHEIQSDSIYQTKWRGDTTARSQLLMRTRDKTLPPDISVETNFDLLSPDDRKAEIIKVVAKYYNVWEPPPNPAERMIYLEKEILTKIEYDSVKFSLTCRGKTLGDMNKMQLVETLYDDVILEKKLLGERAHRAIKEIETQIAGLLRRKKNKLADQFKKRIEDMWAPLREVQSESKANEIAKRQNELNQLQMKSAENYQEWRLRITKKREEMEVQHSPRGNSIDIHLIGATPRGPEVATPRGYEAALHLSAGSAHVALVHKTGHLYTWGVGASGRLGHDLTEQGDPQADCAHPTLVQSLAEKVVTRVACGFSHTGAILAGGDVYFWGSTASGKCGLGPIVQKEECYCSIPTRIIVGAEDRRVKKLSCGSAHSAVITENGHLYVFGCGDGGRLGRGKRILNIFPFFILSLLALFFLCLHVLGVGLYETCYVPTLVTNLLHEKCATVSCGNSTTLVATEITYSWSGEMEEKYRKLVGGRLYVAGAANVLGKQYDEFTELRFKGGLVDAVTTSKQKRKEQQQQLLAASSADYEETGGFKGENDDNVPIKQVSAGFAHSVLVSAEGEVFTFGSNYNGACGQPLAHVYVDKPTPVQFLYTRPINLAIGKKAYQSSIYNSRDAKYAVNSRKEGNGVNRCAVTQQESQPWIEIDLGTLAMVDKICVYNRTGKQLLCFINFFPLFVAFLLLGFVSGLSRYSF